MNASSFVNPLEIVQYISVFSYMNTLSDFLYVENYLQEDEQNKRIPIVNALYDYLHDYDYNQATKKKLIRKLLEGSDLYGEDESEILDVHFVNIMFEYIITSLVFDKYRNIYGFLAEIISSLDDATIYSFNERVLEVLETKTFENEFGEDSTLSRFSVARIFADLIMPLFPQPKNDMRLLSVDYIYAQAGSMFLRSSKRNSAYYSETNFFGMSVTGMNIYAEIISYLNSNTDIFEIEGPSEKPTDFLTFQKYISISDDLLDEYIGIGHGIEELVLDNELDKSVLSSFALPALLYSAVSKKNNIDAIDIEDIMENPTYMSEAYELLFSYLEDTFEDIEKVEDEDYRYQFHLALSAFKNRKELEKLPINEICSLLAEYEASEDEQAYQNESYYQCSFRTKDKLLHDIDVLFEKQNSYIRDKYFLFEKQMIREAFGQDLIESVNAANLNIIKGAVFHFDCDLRISRCPPTQLVRPSDDLLEFYDLDNHNTSYYALIRQDDDVTLIKETDDPMLFRKKLHIGNVNIERYWNPYKNSTQDFNHFLNKLAGERADNFKAHLNQISTHRTEQSWWKEFGLSLIPFYSCITSGVKGRIINALIACPIDIIFVNPIIKGVSFATKVTRAATRHLLSKMGTTIESMSLKASIRSIVKTESYAYGMKNKRLETIVSKNILKDFQNSPHLLVDSGSELLSTLGKNGIESLREFYLDMKSLVKYPFKSLIAMVDVAENIFTREPNIIGEKFGRNIYVNNLFGSVHSGYGYKFLKFHDDRVAHLRKVLQEDGGIAETLVILVDVTDENENLYKIADPQTGMVKKHTPYLYANGDGYLVEYSERKSYKYSFASFDDDSCDMRFKRTLSKKLSCFRTNSLKKKLLRESEAVAIAQNKFPEEQIRNELRKYAFVDEGKTERDFVEEWLVNGKKPEWSHKYKIEEPEYFFKLKYTVRLDSKDIIEEEAVKRIDSLYTKNQQRMIEAGTITGKIGQVYMESKAYNTIVFEDYYALRNYMAFGSARITANTDEARRMKNAIYILAMRQADDPIPEFATTLYRGEVHSHEALTKMFSGEREFVLNKFTSASQSESVASGFAKTSNRKRRGLLLKMNFKKNKRYLRSNVNKIYSTLEKETILLPGSKFKIEKVTKQKNFGGRFYVELTFMHDEPTQVEWQKNIMHMINKLKSSNTMFYYQEPSTS